MNTTKIVQEITLGEYEELISKYSDRIVVSSHTLDILSNSQRKVFKEENLISLLLKEKPKGIGLQRNGNYAVFFRTGDGYRKLILSIKPAKLEIITFMNTDTIPNLKRI